MDFNELVQEVYNITNRPDLASTTESAVRAATLKAHQTDFYSKDIYEAPIRFDEPDYRQSLDYISIIPNYRSLAYMRKYEIPTKQEGQFITIITPTEALDQYGRTKIDVAYVAGRVIQIRSSTKIDAILFAAYVLPTVATGNFSSWVAELYPWAIIHEAARVVSGAISKQDEKRAQAELAGEAYIQLKRSALPDEGF